MQQYKIHLNLPIRISIDIVFLFVGISTMHTQLTRPNSNLENYYVGWIIAIVSLGIWGVLRFCILPYSKTVIDTDGIRQIFEFRIGKWCLYGRKKEILWANAESFEKSAAGYLAGYQIWGTSNISTTSLIVLNSGLTTFGDSAREFIINQIGISKVKEGCKKKLIKSKLFLM